MVGMLFHIVVKKILMVTFGSGLMESTSTTTMKVLSTLQTMVLWITQKLTHTKMQESQLQVQMDMFLLLHTMKTLIGYSLHQKFLETVHFLLVIISSRTKRQQHIQLLYWAVVGMVVLVLVVSIGMGILLLLVVVMRS